MAEIKITIDRIKLGASLDLTSEIGNAVFAFLPMTARFERWGDEICFPLDLQNMNLNAPVTTVQIGDIAYSAQWKAFCLFYGKTPLSSEFDIIPNGPVEVIGRLHESESALILKKFFSAYLTRAKRRAFRLLSNSSGYAETITLEKS
jgi:hypothetical protein